MYELFFTINYNYVNEPPLPLPFAVTWALSVLGFILAIFNWRKIKRNVYFVFFSFVSIVFAVSLWINNLNRFHRVGMPVAIHGRYWMPLLPIIILLFGLGIRYTLNRLPDYSNKLTAPLALIVLLLLCQGGGITSFIIKSNADWYWPDKRVDSANSTVRTVLAKLIVH